MAGLYLHVPFCRQACHYCDFHFSTNVQNMEPMVQAILEEARIRSDSAAGWGQKTFQTLYLGGGTPSLLEGDQLKTLVNGVLAALNVEASSLQEVTLEANPEDIAPEKVEAWLEAGITRLSIGVQSFHEDTLLWMNRAHDGEQAKKGIRLAHELGIRHLTIDLIYGVPTERIWEDDLTQALDLPIDHLSAYSLTVEPNTVLGTRISKGDATMPGDERAVLEYQVLCERMRALSWDHYETSNWAAPLPTGGHQYALHNSAYWTGVPYLGLGPGAHGHHDQTRYANVSNNPRYIKALGKGLLLQEEEILTPRDRYNESLMTGLRTARGIHPESLQKDWGKSPAEVDGVAWNNALEQGALTEDKEGRYRIPEPLWITGDQVSASLFWLDESATSCP